MRSLFWIYIVSYLVLESVGLVMSLARKKASSVLIYFQAFCSMVAIVGSMLFLYSQFRSVYWLPVPLLVFSGLILDVRATIRDVSMESRWQKYITVLINVFLTLPVLVFNVILCRRGG